MKIEKRICRNCAIEIPDGTSAKRAFCCNNCRNQYNIERRNERDKEALNFINGFFKNYQVLRIWEKHSELLITVVQLIDNGFSIEFLPEPRKDEIGTYYYFGHFHLYFKDDDFTYFDFRNTKLA